MHFGPSPPAPSTTLSLYITRPPPGSTATAAVATRSPPQHTSTPRPSRAPRAHAALLPRLGLTILHNLCANRTKSRPTSRLPRHNTLQMKRMPTASLNLRVILLITLQTRRTHILLFILQQIIHGIRIRHQRRRRRRNSSALTSHSALFQLILQPRCSRRQSRRRCQRPLTKNRRRCRRPRRRRRRRRRHTMVRWHPAVPPRRRRRVRDGTQTICDR